MKLFTSLACLAIGILALAPILAPARSPDTQTILSFRDGSVSQVATTSPYTLDLKGFTLDLRGFGGLNVTQPAWTGGGTLSHRWTLRGGGAFDGGLYLRWQAGKLADGGLFVGFAFPIRG